MEVPEGRQRDPVFGARLSDRFTPPLAPWPWDTIVARVRERPDEEAIVGVYTKGGRFETARQRDRDEGSLRKGLQRRYPMERWEVHARMVPDTWYHRLLTLTFRGYYSSVEEYDADWAARRRRYAERQGKAQVNKARIQFDRQRQAIQAALDARDRAIEQRRRGAQ